MGHESSSTQNPGVAQVQATNPVRARKRVDTETANLPSRVSSEASNKEGGSSRFSRHADPEVVDLKLRDLTLDETLRLRTMPNKEGLNALAEALKDEENRHPVDAFHDTEQDKRYLADGWMRIAAARMIGLESYPVRLHGGTLRDAVLFAVRANAYHGKPYTITEKRAMVALLLQDPEWRSRSRRWIAGQCNVDHKTVRAIEQRLVTSGQLCAEDPTEVQVMRRGTVYAQKRKVGGTKQAVGSATVPSVTVARRALAEADKHAAGEDEVRRQRTQTLVNEKRKLKKALKVAKGRLFEGRHPEFPDALYKILCGDSTLPSSYERLIGTHRVSCMWTDPPYGVSYKGKRTERKRIRNDTPKEATEVINAALQLVDSVLKPGAPIYIARPGGVMGHRFNEAFLRQPWLYHEDLVWVKGNNLVVGLSDYQYQHELITYGYKKHPGRRLGRSSKDLLSNWYGSNACSTILQFDRPDSSELHPTMKPPELIELCLRNSTAQDDLVLDPFAGSGSTLVAAAKLGRSCYGIELDPDYVAVILKRLHDGFGVEWELISADGRGGKISFL